MAHPVEDGGNHRLRPDRTNAVVHRRVQRKGFNAEEDELERCVEISCADQLRVEHRVAVRAEDAQPITADLACACRAGQESHVTCGLRKPRTEVAADRSGTDYEDSQIHVAFLFQGVQADAPVASSASAISLASSLRAAAATSSLRSRLISDDGRS